MYRDPFEATFGQNIYPWRGIYSNNLFPQEWEIINALEGGMHTGKISFAVTTTGGVGDLFLFNGEHDTFDPVTNRRISAPSAVIKSY